MAFPVISHQTPSPGFISWTAFHIVYQGVDYLITAGNSALRFVWWQFNAGVPTIVGSNTMPALTPDDCLLFLNKTGVGLNAMKTQIIDGELIVSGSILADAIGANQITAPKILAGTIDASHISAGAIDTNALAAGAVTADKILANSIGADQIMANSVTVDKLASGELSATVAVLGELTVGSGISITPAGGVEVVHQQDGGPGIPRIASVIKAAGISLRAAVTAVSLVVEDKFKLFGVDNEITTGAELVVQSGITPPKQLPLMSGEYPQRTVYNTEASDRGLVSYPAAGAGRYLSTASANSRGQIVELVRTANDDFDYVSTFEMALEGQRTEIFSAIGGIAVIGSDVFTMCEVNNETYAGRKSWYVYKWSTTGPERFNYVNRFRFQDVNVGAGSPLRPLLGNDTVDPTTFIIVQGLGTTYPPSYRYARWRYDANLTYVSYLAFNDAGGATTFENYAHPGGIVRGVFDGRPDLWYIAFTNSITVYAFDVTTGNRIVADEFLLPAAGPFALIHDGTRFISRAGAAVTLHSRITDTASLQSVHTWRKADAVGPDYAQYETIPSPPAINAVNKRAWLRLQTPADIPPVGGADSVSFYTKLGAGAWFIVPPPVAGVQSQLVDVLPTSGPAPPAVTNFGAGTPGIIKSFGVNLASAKTWELKGTGEGRAGPLSWNSDGVETNRPAGGILYGTQNYAAVGYVKVTVTPIEDTTYAPFRDGVAISTGGLLIPVAGYYAIHGKVSFGTGTNNVAGRRGVAVSPGASPSGYYPNTVLQMQSAASGTIIADGIVYIPAGTVLFLWVYTDIVNHYSNMTSTMIRVVRLRS